MSMIKRKITTDQRLPSLAVMELSCGHRLLINQSSPEAVEGIYTLGTEFDCPACKYNYQRIKTVKGWPTYMDYLLACGHLETRQPYFMNIEARTCYIVHDTDTHCSICSTTEGDIDFA